MRRATSSTRSRVAGMIEGRLLMARETVIFETPSSRAMSASVTGMVLNRVPRLPKASYMHQRFCATRDSRPAALRFETHEIETEERFIHELTRNDTNQTARIVRELSCGFM